jgi:putative DNA primase/helicase
MAPTRTLGRRSPAEERDRALSALHALDPGCGRDRWHEIGRAALAADLTIEDIDHWSSTAGNYKGSHDVVSAFKNINPDGGTSAGTLYFRAREAGWSEGSSGASRHPAEMATRPQQESLKARHAGESATAIWARLEPATSAHPYIVQKQAEGVPLDGLRVVPAGDPLKVAGQSMAGALVVPVLPLEGGDPVSLQFIAAGAQAEAWRAGGRPTKLNLPGAAVTGVFVVGDMAAGGTVYLTEGLSQAWACWLATGRAAVVAFGWGRVRGVAVELRQRDPEARLTICPDSGKEQAAFEIAAEVSATVAALPPGWPQNADLADFAMCEGIESLERLLEEAKPPEPPPMPFVLVPVADLDAEEPPAPEFVWENLVPAEAVTLLAAHGGTGKSFVALMLCVAVALGLPLFGLGTRQRKAAFFSGEDGAALLRYRLRFVCQRMGVDVRELEGRLFIIDATEHDPRLYCEATSRRDGDLTPTFESLRELVQREGIGLLVLDNASDTFDASEIDRARVRAFMRALTVLARQAKAALLLLAHVDKGTSRGDRGPNAEGYSGSTAWHNSARSRLFMRRDAEGALLLEHQKGTHSAGLMSPLRLVWVKDGIPVLDGPVEPVVQGIADRSATKALLRLIHEFTSRSEHISAADNSHANAYRKLEREPTFPSRMKRPELFDLLRRAERAGHLRRALIRTTNRKERETWEVTPEGRTFAEIVQCAPSAPSAGQGADIAPAAGGAPSAPTHGAGVRGESARTLWSKCKTTARSPTSTYDWAVNGMAMESAYGT